MDDEAQTDIRVRRNLGTCKGGLFENVVAEALVKSGADLAYYNQLRKDHNVVFSGVGDFLVDGTWNFEVGGAGKGFDQVKDIPTAYVVNDDTEIGLGQKIPLWLFGMMY